MRNERRKWSRAATLVVVILLMLMLAVLSKALVNIVTSKALQSRQYQERVSAGFVLKAAILDSQTELSLDPGWNTGFQQKPLGDIPGEYTVSFGPSVNNMASSVAADGPRGEGTVPPFSAELTVSAQVGGTTRAANVVISKTVTELVPYALTASGRVRLQGDVRISGIANLIEPEARPAGVHSNRSDETGTLISWQKLSGGDQAQISGVVSVGSENSGAIDFDSGADVVGGFRLDEPVKPFPEIDILGLVAAKSASPPFIPTIGTTVLGSGEYFSAGDVVLNGDLLLSSGTLYINGDLTVNGTISGRGAVYTTGRTSFKGDSNVVCSNDNGVALFSRGAVELTGYDGSAYLADLAASDSTFETHLDDTQQALAEVKSILASSSPADIVEGGSAHDDLDDARMIIGQDSGGNNAGRMADIVASQPSSSIQSFVHRKLVWLEKIFAGDDNNRYNATTPSSEVVANWREGGGDLAGIMDGAMDELDQDMMATLQGLVGQFDFDKLGISYFQGLIYTNGYIYCANEIHVVGSIWAVDNGSQSSVLVGGEVLEPGDVFLSNNTQLVYNEDYVLNPGGIGVVTPLRRASWIEP